MIKEPKREESRMKFVPWVLIGLLSWAQAEDRWARRKGDCEQLFQSWRNRSTEQLRGCLMRWEMYRDVTQISPSEKAIVREAFDKLYHEGDRREAIMALSALKRMGLKPSRLRDEAAPRVNEKPSSPQAGGTAPGVAPGLEHDPDDRTALERLPDRGAAEDAAKRGNRLYRSGRYADALGEFLLAYDSDPTYALPLYMAARCSIKMNQAQDSILYLRDMKFIGSEMARQLLTKAGQDPAFARLQSSGAFKDLTGTALVQILNGAGEKGVSVVKGYKKELERLGLVVAGFANDRYPRTAKMIYTKPGYEEQGENIRRFLSMGMVHKKNIDWPSQYDVIVIYGARRENRWVDDEAEKAGEDAKKKKKKEEDEKQKALDAHAAQKAKMQEQMQMMKMLQEMNSQDAAKEAVPAEMTPPP